LQIVVENACAFHAEESSSSHAGKGDVVSSPYGW
jgi:hypothetical protein